MNGCDGFEAGKKRVRSPLVRLSNFALLRLIGAREGGVQRRMMMVRGCSRDPCTSGGLRGFACGQGDPRFVRECGVRAGDRGEGDRGRPRIKPPFRTEQVRIKTSRALLTHDFFIVLSASLSAEA